jgi:biopolymer transport protein ExbB/TolQ
MNLFLVLSVIVSILFFAVLALSIMVFSLKKEIFELKRYSSKLFSRLTGVMQDMQSMSNATYGIGKQVNHINDQVKNIDARQDEFDIRDQGNKPVQQAIALVEKGATLEEVMENCNLSRGEAELLFRIHGDYD